jgi:hypothetical protein
LIVVTEPLWLIVAAPVVTAPPVGAAKLIVLPAISADTTKEILPPLSIRKRELEIGGIFHHASFEKHLMKLLSHFNIACMSHLKNSFCDMFAILVSLQVS